MSRDLPSLRQVGALCVVYLYSVFVLGACGPGQASSLDNRAGRAFPRPRSAGTTGQLITVPDQTMVPTDVTGGHAIGTSQGSFDVTADGQATYTVPVWTPKGREGIEPKLALGYASGTGNGLVGVGWQLKGLSTISRCPRTLAQDGLDWPVTLDLDPAHQDAYCLDGQRLVLASGTYGADGAEYRTEVDSYRKIVSVGRDGQGPVSFKVYERDGRISSYGSDVTNTHSRVEGSRTTTLPHSASSTTVDVSYTTLARLSWLVSRVEDRYGNALVVTYSNTGDGPSGYEALPQRIDYTFSKSGTPAPNRSVVFGYETRPDTASQFVGGFHLKSTQRLTSISINGPAPAATGLLKTYRLAYSNSGTVTARSLLQSLTECDAQGVCLSPTTFAWQNGDPGVNDNVVFTAAANEQIRNVLTGDVDGDGQDDVILYLSGGSRLGWYFLNRGGGTPVPIGVNELLDQNNLEDSPQPASLIDVDHDGRADFVITRSLGSGSKTTIYRSTSVWGVPRFTAQYTWSNVTTLQGMVMADGTWINPMTYLGDFRGRGAPDLAVTEGAYGPWLFASNPVGTSNPTGSFSPGNALSPSGLVPDSVTVANVHGGSTDELVMDSFGPSTPSRFYPGNWYLSHRLLPDGTFGVSNISLVAGDALHPQRHEWFADVNADGLPDAISVDRFNGGLPTVAINTGWGFLPPTPVVAGNQAIVGASAFVEGDSSVTAYDNGLRFVDWNGDGYVDMVRMQALKVTGFTGPSVSYGPTFTNVQGLGVGAGNIYPTGDFNFSQLLDENGDGLPDFVQVINGQLHLYLHGLNKPDLMTDIVNGFGKVIHVGYGNLSNPYMYSPGITQTPIQYPAAPVTQGLWSVMVVTVTSDGPFGSPSNVYNYSYTDARVDLLGRGSLGFGTREVVDAQTGAITTTWYDHNTRVGTLYPVAYLPHNETTRVTVAGNTVHESSRAYTYGVRTVGPAQQIYRSAESRTESEGPSSTSPLPVVRSENTATTVDNYGNVTQSTHTSGDGWVDVTTTAFDTGTVSSWLVSLPTSEVVTSKTPDGKTGTRTTNFVPDEVHGVTAEMTEYPGSDATLYRHTVFDRDSNLGVVKAVHVGDLNGQTRTNTLRYDPADSIYPVAYTNALGQSRTVTYLSGLGVLAQQTDLNGVPDQFQYDGFGRLRSLLPANGNFRYLNYLPGDARWPLMIRNVGQDSQIITDNFDVLGQNAQHRQVGFDGQGIITNRTYDQLGRLSAVYGPVFENSVAKFTASERYTYDGLSRRTSVTWADNAQRTYAYDGNNTSISDENGGYTHLVRDQLGNVTQSQQRVGAGTTGRQIATTFKYGLFGELDSVTDSAGNQTVNTYDSRGRRTKLVDPDAGPRLFGFNAFDELLSEQDASGRLKRYVRDALGRATSITSPDGTSTYVWDTAANGLGSLASSSSSDGVFTLLSYDELGRPSGKLWEVGGRGVFTSQTYDFLGRLLTKTFPSVPGQPYLFTLSYGYTPSGFMQSIRNASTGTAYWTGNNRTAVGQLAQETLGNGVSTLRRYDLRNQLHYLESTAAGATVQRLAYDRDPRGLVTSRNDLVAKTTEDFQYDPLQRLTARTVYQSCGSSVETYGYDDLGNLTSRTAAAGGGTSHVYSYAGAGGPHAIKSADGVAFRYDANGNQLNYDATSTVSPNMLGLPKSIVHGSITSTFGYDGADQRILKADSDGSQVLSLDSDYERRTVAGVSTDVFSIQTPERTVAEVLWTERTGGVDERVLYLHDDNLGSVETVTNSTGGVVEHRKYNPFGQRVAPAALVLPLASVSSGDVTDGFTGHVNDDELALVNMGGRLYAPSFGRFLSPDPVVTEPYDSQTHSRYGYVRNNPLNRTDPTGFYDESGGVPTGYTLVAHSTSANEEGGTTTVDVYAPATNAPSTANPPVNIVDNNGPRATAWNPYNVADRVDAWRQRNYQGRPRMDWLVGQTASQFADLLRLGSGFGSIADSSLTMSERVGLVGKDVGRALLIGALLSGLGEEPKTGCFLSGTRVLMADGSLKPIEQVQVGDEVRNATPEARQSSEGRRVTAVLHNWTNRVVHLRLQHRDGTDAGSLEPTEEHLVWTQNLGWRPARELAPGDTLSTEDGRDVVVGAVENRLVATDTYNLSVEGVHTFFVAAGDVAVLVHNAPPAPFNLYDVARYGEFKTRVGDGLDGHELLPNSWLRANGFGSQVGNNPAMALDRPTHEVISIMQRQAGAYDAQLKSSMTAEEMIDLNAHLSRLAGIPEAAVTAHAEASRQFAEKLATRPCQ